MRRLKLKKIAQRRRGITLIEVLTAVGVAAVGMFGVFVLIPMCARQAELGQTYDQASALSKTAVARFKNEGMGDPDNWRRTGTVTAAFPQAVNTTPDSMLDADSIPDWRQNAFCIDPQRLALFPDDNLFPTPSTLPSGRTAGQRCIERITYAKVSGATSANVQALAAYIFQANDDVRFNGPADKQQMPEQQYVRNGTGPVQRTSAGRMSWIAMFEPQPGVIGSELYRLYIVTFKNRYLNVDNSTGSLRATEERVFEPNVTPVDSRIEIVGTGLSGGDWILKGEISEEFPIRRNNWVMLQSTATPSIFAWYRVVRADANPDGDPGNIPANFPETYVTLEGGDWPFAQDATRAIFIPEVVMVYEKTIKLGDDSLFSIK